MKFKKFAPKKNAAQAIVEFAIVLPLLLLLLYGLLEAGRLLFIYSSVVNASRQAVRYGATTGVGTGGVQHRYWDCAGIRAAAQKVDFLNAFDDEDVIIAHDGGSGSPTQYCGNGDPVTAPPASDTTYIPSVNNTDRLVVTIKGDFNSLVPKIVPFISRTRAKNNPITITSARTIVVGITIDTGGSGGGGVEPSTFTVTTSPNPSQVNEPVMITATLTGSAGAPQGTVTFKDKASGTTLCTVTLASGTANCGPVTFPAIATYTIVATFDPSTSDYLTKTVEVPHVVGPSTTVTTITDSPDPSLPNTSVSIYVTVANQYGGTTPTGKVSINTAAGKCNNLTLSGGVASCNVTYTATGSSTITASYTPADTTKHKASTGSETHTVVTTLPTATTAPTATSLPTSTPLPTAVPTAVSGCDSLRSGAGTVQFSSNTMTLRVPNTNGYAVAIDHVFVAWNYSAGHSPGDSSLWLQQAKLNSTVFWAGTPISLPGTSLTPSTPVSIPANGIAMFTFTFDKVYNGNTSGVEQVQLYFSTPGCEGYPVVVPSSAPTITPAPPASAKLQYKAANVTASSQWIRPHFNIVNTGLSALPLSGLKIRYWYTREGTDNQNFSCDYAAVNCSYVTGTFVAVSPTRTGANYYLEVGFTTAAGSVAAGGQSGEIQTGISMVNWGNYTQTDDYSYDPTKSSFADWTKVTLYYNGVLIWGTEP